MTALAASDQWWGDTPGDLHLSRLIPGAARPMLRRIDDRDVIWIDVDQPGEMVHLSSTTSSKIECGLRTAHDVGLPVVLVLSSAGADIVEGHAGAPRVGPTRRGARGVLRPGPDDRRSSTVPPCPGRRCCIGLADFTVMTASSYAFVNGPVMVEQFTGIGIDIDELGGATNLARYTGVPTMVVADRDAAIEAVENLLAYLPDNVDVEPERWAERRSGRSPVSRSRRPDAGDVDRQLRRAQGRRGDRRRRQPARAARPLGRQHGHRLRHDRRPADRHRRQPADVARRHPRHPRLAEGRPVRRVLRRVQPADPHARRHARASTPARISSGAG